MAIKVFTLKNGKTRQWGITKFGDFDWRIDLYFWSWTFWLEEDNTGMWCRYCGGPCDLENCGMEQP